MGRVDGSEEAEARSHGRKLVYCPVLLSRQDVMDQYEGNGCSEDWLDSRWF